MLRLAQTMHLSSTDTNTVSIRNEMERNELSLEPHHLGVHWVRPKQFLGRWYVWHKPCTYLALIVTVSKQK
jgi:hypothetical protein